MGYSERKIEAARPIEDSEMDQTSTSSLKKAERILGLEPNYNALSIIEITLGAGDGTLEIKKNDIGGLTALVRDKKGVIIFETSDPKDITELKKAANHQTVVEELTLKDAEDDYEDTDIEED